MKPGKRVQSVQLCGLKQGCAHRPAFCAAFVAGAQTIPARDANRVNLLLDHVVINVDVAIIEQQDQSVPVVVGITDMLGQLGFCRETLQGIFAQGLELFHHQPGLRLARGQPMLSARTTDVRLDPVDVPDQLDELRNERRRRWARQKASWIGAASRSGSARCL